MTSLRPTFFDTPVQFRRWLERHHDRETALLVGFYKRRTGKPTLTYPQALDEALCFGWIDGVRKRLDEDRYTIRFTPRRARSYWSEVNTKRMRGLMDAGRVHEAGMRAFEARDASRTARYSFERATCELSPEFEKRLRANRAAWTFFQSRPPSYRRVVTWWIMGAKKEQTRERRLAKLIEDSAHERSVSPMLPAGGRRAAAGRARKAAAGAIVIALLSAAPAAQRPVRAQDGKAAAPARSYYYPGAAWEQRQPQAAGMDGAKLDAAIQFAIANENPATKDLAVDLATTFGGREPFDTPIGPVAPRGGLNGLIVKNGYIVAEWGETRRVDMTFSVTKSFLSTVVGLAWQKGLIKDVNDPAGDYVPGDLFEGPHNSRITWDHLLRQTSDWQGTLWGKPDWADRPEGQTPADWPKRPQREPGTFYKYNDVRVNVLALAALHVLRRPLPQVLREDIMEPIGASTTWRWHGYDNAWIELDGQKMQSMTGGGHWGGGMFISARDMARFGYLFLRNGRWNDRELVSPKWIAMARTPGVNPTYGFMNWFLNTDRKLFPNAPASSVTFQGNGSNIIYIDWENDLLVVVRWIQQRAFNDFIGQVLGAITSTSNSQLPTPKEAARSGGVEVVLTGRASSPNAQLPTPKEAARSSGVEVVPASRVSTHSTRIRRTAPVGSWELEVGS
jgi:CubicO group peptidase (beta-lactamase class C family)/uncharacterized protein YdeI (YjbR/CyaY-like superfamily)